MSYKLKNFVVFFKVLTCLLISRSFGNIILKCDQTQTTISEIHARDTCVINAHAIICAVNANRVCPAADAHAVVDVRLCCRL